MKQFSSNHIQSILIQMPLLMFVAMGQAAKLCNNLALAIEMIAVSEAMTLGVKLGMDPKVLTGSVETGT